MIVSGGENVYSIEVENAISTLRGVAQVAVIGIPHDILGEQVHAIVVIEPGADITADDVTAHARKRISCYKVPRSVELRTEPLPLSGALKPLKRELRRRFWEREPSPEPAHRPGQDLGPEKPSSSEPAGPQEFAGNARELTPVVADLRRDADGVAATGEWLANAMRASWDLAASLIDIDGLAHLLGERHRIIANDWHAAGIASSSPASSYALRTSLNVDLTPAVIRADLATARRSPRPLYAAAELINHAADLSSDSAGLVNDNERRWRTFRERVVQLTAADGGRQLGG
jgi:hypothetical protein